MIRIAVLTFDSSGGNSNVLQWLNILLPQILHFACIFPATTGLSVHVRIVQFASCILSGSNERIVRFIIAS